MIKKLYVILGFLSFLPLQMVQALTIQFLSKKTKTSETILKLKFNLTPNEQVLKDSLQFSTDHPAYSVNSWKTKHETTSHYVSNIKSSKRMFNQSFTAFIKLHTPEFKQQKQPLHLHISYFKHMYQKTTPGICMLAVP